jgi:hypothetical protein
MFRSSPSRMRGGGQDTGERVDRRFRWFEKPSPRPHIGSHSQPHGDELSPDSAKGLSSSGLLRTPERRFTIDVESDSRIAKPPRVAREPSRFRRLHGDRGFNVTDGIEDRDPPRYFEETT